MLRVIVKRQSLKTKFLQSYKDLIEEDYNEEILFITSILVFLAAVNESNFEKVTIDRAPFFIIFTWIRV